MLCLGAFLAARVCSPKDDALYATFKDLLPLLVAIPAAWLAFAFQRRQSYLQTLRSVFTRTIEAVQAALQYTHASQPPSQEQFGAVLSRLSGAIDEIRGVFKNVGETSERIGVYPFESLKAIHTIVSSLGFGATFQAANGHMARQKILDAWEEMRRPFLREFDRDFPTFVDTPFDPERSERA
jgi:hypothetical protein